MFIGTLTHGIKESFPEMAAYYAQTACEKHFERRSGLIILDDVESDGRLVVALFDNNPYSADPLERPRQIDDFRDRLPGITAEELAFASFPPEGEQDAGYSIAMIIAIERGGGPTGRLTKAWDDGISNSVKRLNGLKGGRP